MSFWETVQHIYRDNVKTCARGESLISIPLWLIATVDFIGTELKEKICQPLLLITYSCDLKFSLSTLLESILSVTHNHFTSLVLPLPTEGHKAYDSNLT